MMGIFRLSLVAALLWSLSGVRAQTPSLTSYNVVWDTPSRNAAESMPCGGGDVGLNVWVEQGELLLYVARSGTFDHNNTLLKLGRVRVRLSPNPFESGTRFRQELRLQEGHVRITGSKGTHTAQIDVWVDVFRPVVHVDISSNRAVQTQATYESWRYADRPVKGKANHANSYKFAPQGEIVTRKDDVQAQENEILFYHANGSGPSVFDVTVRQQQLDSVKNQLYNPLKNLTFGGVLSGPGLKAAGTVEGKYQDTGFRGYQLVSLRPQRQQSLTLHLHTAQHESFHEWQKGVTALWNESAQTARSARKATLDWWKSFWERSFITIGAANTPEWKVGRNYQLFRYMLGCNASGHWPTKFNGGLFTYDPALTDSSMKFTPDFRNWGGGTHTAQNQRLVYWPMLKSGDWALMKPQFAFYQRTLANAELRTRVYWKHAGASFTEQLENFGLPNPAEYSWKRPADYDPGMEYNAWLEYEWDTVLEFCLMMLETERYAGDAIHAYVPFIESCLTFFHEHYQYLAKKRGSKTFDGAGKLILYPGSAAETYKMTYNATSTISALKTVLTRLLELPDSYLNPEKRQHWQLMLSRIPSISFRSFEGHPTLAPAQLWERINNTETPQLYPVFPWGTHGMGRANLDTAINTYRYDPDALRFRSHVGWKQDNIFAARLGLRDEAARLTLLKLQDSGRRFPAFWGPGYDWTPDHNWGGSGMIGLQEMLLQADGRKLYLFPAWPQNWDVHFKLHAPYQTTVEGILKNGKLEQLKVWPEERRKDVVVLLPE
ncbi:hypothetical protein BWI93_03505 [Siphonobacter sp. BAB-5385]|nr:hypothetical protein BWI93_03505 [Siphonobacter sp. BAB-5385]